MLLNVCRNMSKGVMVFKEISEVVKVQETDCKASVTFAVISAALTRNPYGEQT